jgi:hypothetical protein
MISKHPIEEQPIINQLREEYFDRLPEIRRVMGYLEAEVRYHTRHILQGLRDYEQLVIRSRVKDCESAIQTLRRKKDEGGTFDPERPEKYLLTDLPDLAAVRVLVFPRKRLIEVDNVLRARFTDWNPDPVPVGRGAVQVPKYCGICSEVSLKIQAEYQIVPMLIGLYWQVEHAAIYKPPPLLKGKAGSSPINDLSVDVECALLNFEAEFESFVQDSDDSTSGNSK